MRSVRGDAKERGRSAPPRAAVAGRAPARVRVVPPLVAWYARARRDLPWRRSRDPYRVWVSEIMLQQTQVERVKEFFARFLAAFPTVERLAEADEAEVLKAWEGLGYYRRARQLHAAARTVAAEHGGRFPDTAAGLRMLPGIGRYTAAAIASIAFGRPEPIVEANSRRVLARLVGHAAPLDGPEGDEPMWRVAAGLVPATDPGRFNQALMDLGAMVCTVDRPLCGSCPLAAACVAHRQGRTAEIPAKAARRKAVAIRETAVVVRREGKVLVVRRGPGEWWEGLWDLPRVAAVGRSLRRAIAASPLLGPLAPGPTTRLGSFSHGVTHHRITLDVVACDAGRGLRGTADRRWLTPSRLSALAMTAPGRRIARLLAEGAFARRRGAAAQAGSVRRRKSTKLP